MATAVFPGSFDPFSVAHLGIVDAAREQLALDRIVCTISVDPLGKNRQDQTPVRARIEAIDTLGETRPWLAASVTHARHLADIADGYDWLIVGADKWEQLHDVAFYDGPDAMAAAVASLPRVVYVPRAGIDATPPAHVTVIDVDPALATVSSTAIRAGRWQWRALQPADIARRPEDDEGAPDHRIHRDGPEHP